MVVCNSCGKDMAGLVPGEIVTTRCGGVSVTRMVCRECQAKGKKVDWRGMDEELKKKMDELESKYA